EQLGIGAGVGDAHGAIGGDNFGFQKAGPGGAVAVREAAKNATLNETRHPGSRGTRALHKAAPASRVGGVCGQPQRHRPDSHTAPASTVRACCGACWPSHPWPTKASWRVMVFISRVQIIRESAALEVP